MKKYLFFLTFLIVVLLLPTSVLAVDFSIENTEIHAYLQENGDVTVTEQHIYQFDGDFNGITRTLIPKRNTQIENVQATENGQALEVEREDSLYKIYRGGSDETITIDLSYTIKNGVERYQDLAQFYWPFFDSNNESTYLNMDIYIHPPQPTGEVIAFGYDEAEDTFRSVSDGVVHFALGEVESGRNGDIRVGYDATLFPSANIVADKNIRGEILAAQTELVEKRIAFENRQEFFAKYTPFVVGALTLFLLILLLVAWRKKKMILWEVERNSLHASFLPKEEMSLPATILYMKRGAENSNLLSAALLDLVRKGYVKSETEEEFVVVHQNTDVQHESFLINWLFYTIGKKGIFSLSALEKYLKKETGPMYYQKDLSEWKSLLKEEMNSHQLMEKKKALRITVGIMGFFLLPLAIVLLVHDLYMWMFLTLLLSGSLMVFSIAYHPRTEKGVRIKSQWEHFSNKYTGIDEKEWNEWMSDEQMKAFIYAVGTGNKSMLKVNETLSNSLWSPSHDNHSTSYHDIVMLMIIAGAMNNQFKEADRTAYASSSTTNSSFSGGGGGVGGGGGGSGAF